MNIQVGRNEDCPCGSGKKYKKCCGNSNFNFKFTFDSALNYYLNGNFNLAEELIRQIISHPSQVDNMDEIYSFLGAVLVAQKKHDEALECFQNAIKLSPEKVEAYINLGATLHLQGKLSEAERILKQALNMDKKNADVYSSLGRVYYDMGNVEEGIAMRKKAVDINPRDLANYSSYLYMLNYSSQWGVQAIFKEHERYGEFISNLVGPQNSVQRDIGETERRIKIGYMSPDFRLHAVSYFIEPILASHNHDEFKVYCYSDVGAPDDTTRRIQNLADVWRDVTTMSRDEVTNLVIEDEIDILIDLTGHTGRNRMDVFAKKPAPIQITWFGYPNTTGLKTMDYVITDHVIAPDGLLDGLFTEQLLRMPNSFICYLPPKESPRVGDLPLLNNKTINFGSFNNLSKITPKVIDLWSSLLRKIPNSRLFLRYMGLNDEKVKNEMKVAFKQRGIDPDRLDLTFRDSPLKLMNDYNQIDIGLDTFPYNGTTTTCEALWMGVPVVTLAGDSHVSRVGTSILSNVGLSDLVAKDPNEYIDIVMNLVNDRDRLVKIRSELREKMSNTISNSKNFTQNLEELFRSVWLEKCSAKIQSQQAFALSGI